MTLRLSEFEKLERFGVRLQEYKKLPHFQQHYNVFKDIWVHYATQMLSGKELTADEWSEFNTRYGINSVEGTECEMMATYYFLKQGHSVTVTQDKGEQVSGIDLWIQKPLWKQPYSVSVKKRAVNNNIFEIRLSDFLKSSKISRIAYIDPINNVVIEGKYWSFMRLTNGLDVRRIHIADAKRQVEFFTHEELVC